MKKLSLLILLFTAVPSLVLAQVSISVPYNYELPWPPRASDRHIVKVSATEFVALRKLDKRGDTYKLEKFGDNLKMKWGVKLVKYSKEGSPYLLRY